MGQRLLEMYEFIDEQLGLVGKMKLAMLTKIPSATASSTPDSPQNVQKFVDAVRTLTGRDPPSR